jgi:squalene synthase HpnC/squalene synthase HpnD
MAHHGFLWHLRRYGPGRMNGSVTLAEARSYCRHLALTHYENFSVASLLLPRRLLRHFHHIYAYCRWADDLADESGGGDLALGLLQWWREELLHCYEGKPRHPVMVALRETIKEFDIPARPFLDLLRAFEQDQIVKDYRTYEQLLAYCRCSANPVGHLILYLGRCFEPRRAELADCICTGLQLANFWQDVRRDLDIGRVYLPAEDRERYGYSDEDLQQRRFTPAFAELMKFEVDRTRELFRKGAPLVELMPADLQVELELFIRGGLGILERIERQRYDVWRRRPTLGKLAKAAQVGGGIMTWSLARSFDYCTRLTRQRAGNFFYAFLILPRAQRRAMCTLYAFMRIADDLTDSDEPIEQKWVGLQAWRRGLIDALSGRCSHPVHPALVHVVERYRIPPLYLQELLDGVQEDLIHSRYASFEELYRYCYRVASAVGLACIHVWGYDDAKAEQYAEWSGIAFQLTNIVRDVAEDARHGRIYLPQEDLLRFGCTEEQLLAGPFDVHYQQLMQFQVDRARDYYERARPLWNHLQPAGRAVFQVMTGIYEGILDAIERRGFDQVCERVRLSPWHKAGLLLQAVPVRFGWS